jgi:hypothetical protein
MPCGNLLVIFLHVLTRFVPYITRKKTHQS